MVRPGTKWALEEREREMEEEKGEGQREVQVSKVKNWKDQRAETLIIRLPISSLSQRGAMRWKKCIICHKISFIERLRGWKAWNEEENYSPWTHTFTHKKTWCTQTLALLPEWPIWSRSTNLHRKMAVLDHTSSELVFVREFKLSTLEARYTFWIFYFFW